MDGRRNAHGSEGRAISSPIQTPVARFLSFSSVRLLPFSCLRFCASPQPRRQPWTAAQTCAAEAAQQGSRAAPAGSRAVKRCRCRTTRCRRAAAPPQTALRQPCTQHGDVRRTASDVLTVHAPADDRSASRARTRSACGSRRAATCLYTQPAAGCGTRATPCARSRTLRGGVRKKAQHATRNTRRLSLALQAWTAPRSPSPAESG